MIFESHRVELKELTDLQSVAKALLTNCMKLYFYTLAVTPLLCDVTFSQFCFSHFVSQVICRFAILFG